jgi:hypothetical protein
MFNKRHLHVHVHEELWKKCVLEKKRLDKMTLIPITVAVEYTGCIKKSSINLKSCINLFRGHNNALDCHNITKHTEFHLG